MFLPVTHLVPNCYLGPLLGLSRQISESTNEGDAFAESMKRKIQQQQRKALNSSSTILTGKGQFNPQSSVAASEGDRMGESEDIVEMMAGRDKADAKKKVNERTDEFNRLKEDLLKSRRAVQVFTCHSPSTHLLLTM